jgi:hypothetical protein
VFVFSTVVGSICGTSVGIGDVGADFGCGNCHHRIFCDARIALVQGWWCFEKLNGRVLSVLVSLGRIPRPKRHSFLTSNLLFDTMPDSHCELLHICQLLYLWATFAGRLLM